MANACKIDDKLYLGNVKFLIIRTGNIISELKRKTTLTPADELLECLGITLEAWAKQVGPDNGIDSQPVVECRNAKTTVKINKDERKDLKLTVKVLLNSFESSVLVDAVTKALEELDVPFVESVIIAFPPTEDKLTLHQIRDVWMTLEELVSEGKILTIGISDLDTELLIELHNWAKVKPSVNQINLASCCVIPPEMQAFAKDHDIQLLTHNDPKEILPASSLNQLVAQVAKIPKGASWQSHWIVRYSALVKCRGVIQNKGFVACIKQC